MCGLLAAVNLTTAGLHVAGEVARIFGWATPTDTMQSERAIAFLLGISAMWISDLFFEWLSRRVIADRS